MSNREELPGLVCPRCHTANAPGAHFCVGCGLQLSPAEAGVVGPIPQAGERAAAVPFVPVIPSASPPRGRPLPRSVLQAVIPARPATRAFWIGLAGVPFACACSGVVALVGVLAQLGADQSSDPATAQSAASFFYVLGMGLLLVLLLISVVLIATGRPRRDVRS